MESIRYEISSFNKATGKSLLQYRVGSIALNKCVEANAKKGYQVVKLSECGLFTKINA